MRKGLAMPLIPFLGCLLSRLVSFRGDELSRGFKTPGELPGEWVPKALFKPEECLYFLQVVPLLQALPLLNFPKLFKGQAAVNPHRV